MNVNLYAIVGHRSGGIRQEGNENKEKTGSVYKEKQLASKARGIHCGHS